MDAHVDTLIIGAGSGGIGAALASARAGATTLLVEKEREIGGTAVFGGVHHWEMGAGGTGLPFDIYRRLKTRHGAAICSYGRHFLWQKKRGDPARFPGGERIINPQRSYRDTMRRFGARSLRDDEEFVRRHWHAVAFEPDAYVNTLREMLAETGHAAIETGVTFETVAVNNGHIDTVRLSNGRTIAAHTVIDATGTAAVAHAAGAETTTGQESRTTYSEPGAPETWQHHLNGATLIFRVTPRHDETSPRLDSLPADIPDECWWRASFPAVSVCAYPRGDININMLPTMDGAEYARMTAVEAHAECRRRVLAQWHWLQRHNPEWQAYQLTWIAPCVAEREGRRIVGRRVLTENDLRAGLAGQEEPDIITIADHALDTHGMSTARAGCNELEQPYGVPYRCLLTRELDNCLVACKAASFSSLAASSCRLSRTLIQLGQAAGTAAALAAQRGISVATVPHDILRRRLEAQHVQLTWPCTPTLEARLGTE